MDKTTRHVTIARCKECGEYMVSWGGGVFVSCGCGKSFIDQERFGGLYERSTTSTEVIETICPSTCEYREDGVGNYFSHKDNKQIGDKNELRDYLLDNYNYKLPKEY